VIRPLRNYMAVEPLEEALSTIIHVVAERKRYRGRVLAVGRDVAWGTKVDDIVQFTDIVKYPQILYHGEKIILIQEADVLFIEEGQIDAAA